MKPTLKILFCLTLVMLVKMGFVPAVFSADKKAVTNFQTQVKVQAQPVETDGTMQTQVEVTESAPAATSDKVQPQESAVKPTDKKKVEVQVQKPAAEPAGDKPNVEVQTQKSTVKPADPVKVEVQTPKPAAEPVTDVKAKVMHEHTQSVSPGAATGAVAYAKMTAIDAGTLTGEVNFVEQKGGLQINAEVFNVPGAGPHGFHIHEVGACHRNGEAAGGHYNPLGIKHGFLPKDGPQAAHLGDMGNIEVDAKGHGKLSVFLPGVSLNSGEYAVGGRSVILHEKADDFGQPTGNAGGRIGCGIIEVGQNSGK